MSLESLSLLPELERLPVGDTKFDSSTETICSRFQTMKSEQWVIETGVGLEEALRDLYEARHVPDLFREAYQASFTNSDSSLYDHYSEMLQKGDASVSGFISNLKGKYFELQQLQQLREEFPDWQWDLAENPTQPIWDIHGVAPDSSEVFLQLKMGGANYAPEVADTMLDHPEIGFPVSDEIREWILTNRPELADQIIDTGTSNLPFTEDVSENLEQIRSNLGIDVPDKVGDALPYVAETVAAVKWIKEICSTEKEFTTVELEDRIRIHVARTLVLFSRFGITSVCAILGATMASPAELIVPSGGIITALGGIGGAFGGAKLNRKLKPGMLQLMLRVCRLTTDDLFYFQNKLTIDTLGASLASMTIH